MDKTELLASMMLSLFEMCNNDAHDAVAYVFAYDKLYKRFIDDDEVNKFDEIMPDLKIDLDALFPTRGENNGTE